MLDYVRRQNTCITPGSFWIKNWSRGKIYLLKIAEIGDAIVTVKIQTKNGLIDVNEKSIATIVGGAATDMYGVVGMASQNQLRDNVNHILRRDDYSKGIEIHQNGKDINVDIYIIVSYGTKISEVSKNVQAKVKYNLKQMLGITAHTINVIVAGVQVRDK